MLFLNLFNRSRVQLCHVCEDINRFLKPRSKEVWIKVVDHDWGDLLLSHLWSIWLGGNSKLDEVGDSEVLHLFMHIGCGGCTLDVVVGGGFLSLGSFIFFSLAHFHLVLCEGVDLVRGDRLSLAEHLSGNSRRGLGFVDEDTSSFVVS